MKQKPFSATSEPLPLTTETTAVDFSLSQDGPEHGGDLQRASLRYGIDRDRWLDLSTGINPDGYPIPEIPEQHFYRLPTQADEHLLAAAKAYYGAESLLLGAGSQPFIELLPALRDSCRVAIPDVGYQEHAWHWQRCGHQVVWYSGVDPQQLDEKIRRGEVDAAVVINPNNPTTSTVPLELLHDWQQRLAHRQGCLVIDEAFADVAIDSSPDEGSFARFSSLPGVVVLRSLGKFFGLAGIRIGFALAGSPMLNALSSRACLWSVSAVSQYVAAMALADHHWQHEAKQRLLLNSNWMYRTLHSRFEEEPIFKSPLFISVSMSSAKAEFIHHRLAGKGVLARLWRIPEREDALLRFGLISEKNPNDRDCLTRALLSC